jgi:long-subunit fatty acid transport protein
MKQFLRGSAVATMLFFASDVFAQQYNITGAGARAEGFGGAFIGVADDATAVVWNPAGLTILDRPQGSAVVKFIGEKSDFTSKLNAANNESTSLSHAVFNFGSLAIPVKLGEMNLVLAAAYQRQLDFYDSYKQSGYDQEERGGVDTFTPGLGLELSPLFSLGLAANIWFGKDNYDATYDSPTTNNPSTSASGSPSGFNLVAGAMLDLKGLKKAIPLKIGVAVRTPFTLSTDYTFNWTPALLGLVPDAKVASKVSMPLMVGFGGSYQFGENLTVAVDYETRAYGDKNRIDDYTTSIISFTDTTHMSASGKNLNQFRAGAEYLIITDAGVFPVRAGYHNVPTLLAYHDVNGNPTDQQVVGDGFSFGTGYISGSFALDVTFSRATYQAGGVNSTTDYSQTTITGSVIIYF